MGMEYFNEVIGSSTASQAFRFIGLGLAVTVPMFISVLLVQRAVFRLVEGIDKTETVFLAAGLAGGWVIVVLAFFSFV